MREFFFLVLWTGGVTVVPLVTLMWAVSWMEHKIQYESPYHLKWWHVLLGTLVSLVPFVNFLVLGMVVVIVVIFGAVHLDWSWTTRDVFQKPRRSTEF